MTLYGTITERKYIDFFSVIKIKIIFLANSLSLCRAKGELSHNSNRDLDRKKMNSFRTNFRTNLGQI